MDSLVKAADKAAKHYKSCQNCSEEAICDIMADLNVELVKAALRS